MPDGITDLMEATDQQILQTSPKRTLAGVASHSIFTYTVVIPAWNESQHIRETINTLRNAQNQMHVAAQAQEQAQAQQNFSGDIIVVDNNSTDATAEIAKEMGATVVFESVNQIARARNTGAAASNADFMIFLDADTSINATLLKLTLENLAGGEIIGGGSTVTFDREIKGFAKLLVNFWNWWSVKIGAAAGCYIFCTKEAFSAVGGFDEKQYAAEELVLSKHLREYAKTNKKKFVIIEDSPVVSSARKLDWYSKKQKIIQLAVLLIPGATRSRKFLGMWYDRSHITDKTQSK